MKLQSRNLSVQMQGEDVKLLQSELRQLGFTIPAEEIEWKTFGLGTHQAVVELQKKHGLALSPLGLALTILGLVTVWRQQYTDARLRLAEESKWVSATLGEQLMRGVLP
jgi:hypothetical protein